MILIRRFLLVLLTLMPVTVFGVDPVSFDGIWQDESRQNNYYSISQDGDNIVLIDLARLESSRSTFAATYIGPISDPLLIPLGAFPEFPFDRTARRLIFISDKEAILNFENDCDVCSLVAVPLRKIFK